MADLPTGFLVQRRDDGFGEVFPLLPGQRYSLGRAPECRIPVRDDLCSRRHAEVAPEGAGWAVRDLGSLNGTSVNEVSAKQAIPLRPLDVVRLGRTALLYVRTIDELPAIPSMSAKGSATGDG